MIGLLGSSFRHWIVAVSSVILLITLSWGSVTLSHAQDTASTENVISELGEHLEHGGVNCGITSYRDLESRGIELNAETQTTAEILVMLNEPVYVSQPNPDGATPVGIGLYVIEIADIDPSDNTFQVDGFLDLTWCDPRERFDPEETGVEKEIFLEHDVELKLQRMWWPDIEFVNEIQPRQMENEELIIEPDGSIEYREKFSAKLATDFNMQRFPFDTQTLIIEIESFAWSSKDLIFVVEDDIVGFSDEFSIPEWEIIGIQEHLETKQEVRDRNPYSELVVEITVERDPGFYLTKIMIPLIIITSISWAVFWMVGDGLADRMSVSFTGVLAAVAYQFIISEALPRHIYNTFMDAIVLFSFIMMTLTIIENIIANNLHLRDQVETATRLDKASRYLFPIAYFGGIGVLVLLYLGT
jgi:hypothetical protein